MFDEDRLLEKLRAIEALFAGATTDGERDAADQARQRIRARLDELIAEHVVEWRFTLDPWSHRLFIALARRYGIKPYRYKGQRYSTLMVRGPQRFLEEVFIPAYEQMAEILHEHLTEVTTRVVAQALDADTSEAPVVEQGKLPLVADGRGGSSGTK